MIHLDTNFLIRGLLRGTPQDIILRDWLRSGEKLGMSTIAWAELLCGPIETRHLELATVIVSERVPFLEDDSVLAARLFNESGRRRGTLADCMIAATSLRLKAPLATVNPSDFSHFEEAGLTVLTA
jgi:predicted nucleic acid-binding protein